MNTLEYIINKYHLNPDQQSPIEIPNMGRDNLAELFAELKYRIGVEVGTERGIYAQALCKANPKAKLYCIDSWTPYKGYREYVTRSKIEKCHLEATTRLSPYNCKLVKAFSMDAVKNFKPESLDFVYIDANHSFDSVMKDLAGWSPKLRPGGIISGHDYVVRKGPPIHQVVQALKKYTQDNRIKPWFLVGTKAQILGEIRDKCRSWFWVKK